MHRSWAERFNLEDAPAAPAGPWGNVALHSCLQGSTMHTPFCCSNNRISALGALSLGQGLQVNRTLRILVVSAGLMGEALAHTCLCLSTQAASLPHLFTQRQGVHGFQSPDGGRGSGFLL